MRYVTVLFTKTTRIHSERILAVSPEILHTERDELALLSTNVLRDVIVQFFPWYMTNIAEPKLVNLTHWNRRLLKWTEEFNILLKILSFKMFTWFMKSKDCCGRGYFSPDFSPGIPRCRIDSFEVLPAIQRNPRVQVKFVLVRSFWSRYGKNKTVIEMFYTSEHFRKHWKCGESTCWHPEHKGNVRPWKKARLTGDVFEVFGIIVVVGSHE